MVAWIDGCGFLWGRTGLRESLLPYICHRSTHLQVPSLWGLGLSFSQWVPWLKVAHIGQGRNWMSMHYNSANPMGSSELGWPFRDNLNQSKGLGLCIPISTSHWMQAAPGVRPQTWARQLPSAECNVRRGPHLWAVNLHFSKLGKWVPWSSRGHLGFVSWYHYNIRSTFSGVS